MSNLTFQLKKPKSKRKPEQADERKSNGNKTKKKKKINKIENRIPILKNQ